MAVPRVFISSTYYDLRQVRNNIGNFIDGLGYQTIMHERSGVAYTQTNALEIDCYQELASCDIVVCIIGNHFGTKSLDNDFSITMTEIQTALKNKKKVYIFISNDVYIENRTYEQNRNTENFKSAYTDNIKIHEFILKLKNEVKIHLIQPFETTDQIINTLKLQFAGLFQNLLAREASLTESKTAYDLQESADRMNQLIEELKKQKDLFFGRFDGTILAPNYIVAIISKHLGMGKSTFFANDVNSLDDFMKAIGFGIADADHPDDMRVYVKNDGTMISKLVLKKFLFDENNKLIDVRSKKKLEDGIKWTVDEIMYGELPF